MIYLIGGSQRCGKTILAKKISHSQKLSWITTDAIRPILLNSLLKAQIEKKLPQTEMKMPCGKFQFDIYSPKVILKAQLVEAKTMWPSIKALISHLIDRHSIKKDGTIAEKTIVMFLVKSLDNNFSHSAGHDYEWLDIDSAIKLMEHQEDGNFLEKIRDALLY